MTSMEYFSIDTNTVRQSSSPRSEISSPRAVNGRPASDKPSSCLLERISRLQGRLNERMALAGQCILDNKKGELTSRNEHVTTQFETGRKTEEPKTAAISSVSEGSIYIQSGSHDHRRSSLQNGPDAGSMYSLLVEEKGNHSYGSKASDVRTDHDTSNPTSPKPLTQFTLPRSKNIEKLRTKEEEIDFLSSELKSMQEKVVKMEREALSFGTDKEIESLASAIKPLLLPKECKDTSTIRSVSTQTQIASLEHQSVVCQDCERLRRELDDVTKRCNEQSAQCASLLTWIQEINDAVQACRMHILPEKLHLNLSKLNPSSEIKDTKSVVQLIVADMDKAAQYLDTAHDQLHVAHCLDNIFKAQAVAEAKSSESILDPKLQQSDQLFPPALSWLKKALALEDMIKHKDQEIAELNALLPSIHCHLTDRKDIKHNTSSQRKEPTLRSVIDVRKGELEAEMSLLRGRVKALTHELEVAKCSARKSKAIAYSEDEDCFDERDEVQARHLEQHELLGTGAFAEVFKGWWRRPVAIKKFRNLTSQAKLDSFAREVRIHRPLDHPGIVQYYGVCTDLPDMYIVMEYVSGTSFHKLCHERNGAPWDMDEILGLCLQLSDVMCYVHSQNIVHRDLKPPNVLVSEAGFVKLIDFGLSYVGDPSRIPKSSIYAGTPVYLPPEVLREEVVTSKADLYSFGIILWEMIVQDLPWKGINMTQMIAAVATRDERPIIPATVRSDLRDLIRFCWSSDPAQRPEFEEVSRSFREMGAPPAPIRQKPQFQTIQAM